MCIWRNAHFQGGNGAADEPLDENGDNDDEEAEELQNAAELDDGNSDLELDKDIEQVNDNRWCAKISSFFEHVAQVSKKLCTRPGSLVSLDEMMKLLKEVRLRHIK